MSSNPFLGPIITGLSFLEQNPIMDTAVRDTLGNNIPKIALTRSETERMDVAISQIGNTLSFLLGGTAVDQIMKRVFAKAQQGVSTSTKYQWAVASRSVAIYSTMASLMWAMPFIRNYVVTKKTGSVSFSDVIKSGGVKVPPTPEQQVALNASLKDSKKKALTILGVGAAGVMLPAVLGRFAASCTKEAGKEFGHKFLQTISNNLLTKPFMLEGGKFSNLAGIPSMLFWGIPSYIGWYHASRDPYEKQEVAIRAINFVACFFGPTPLINNLLHGHFKEKFRLNDMTFTAVKDACKQGRITEGTKQAAEKFLTLKNAASIGVSIVLLGVTPQLLNIYLTKKRMLKNDQLKKTPLSPLPSPPLNSPNPQPVGPTLNITQAAGVPTFSPAPSSASEAVPSTGPQPASAAPALNQPAAVPFPPLGPYVTGFPPVGLGSRAAFG